MPAEWEPHAATWLTWPHDEAHWPGIFERIPAFWARMVKELETGEDVHILIHDDDTKRNAHEELENAGVHSERVHLHRAPNNFSWTRDHGPIFLKHEDGRVMLSHWRFNGWGEQWPHDLDEHIPEHIADITGFERAEIPMVLEGGSIDVNGRGTLLTTSSCLLNKNRNPELTKEQIERYLRETLGVRHILWLGGEIVGDDTSGHVDDLTRFVAPGTVVTVVESDPHDENFAALQENLTLLRSMKDQDGTPLTVIELPLPSPVILGGTRLPASYANFYIGNAAVLLPVFDDPNDAIAIEALTRAFPDRRVVPINARDLVWGFGAFHCVTQQQPA